MATRDPFAKVETAIRKFALAYPGTIEDHPWGENAYKVKGKIFVCVTQHECGLNVTVKLPDSNAAAMGFEFCKPTGYGLGKSGWIIARFEASDAVPVELLQDWIDESFRATAPKRVVAILDGKPTTVTQKRGD